MATLPLIHTNGSSIESLIEGVCAAGVALQDALDALERATPNQRDYYLLPPAAWKAAIAEHKSRVERVRGVLNEMHEVSDGLTDYQCEIDHPSSPTPAPRT